MRRSNANFPPYIIAPPILVSSLKLSMQQYQTYEPISGQYSHFIPPDLFSVGIKWKHGLEMC